MCSVIQLYPTLCDPTDCSSPGSSVRGTFQARILECHFLFQGIFQIEGIEPTSPVSPNCSRFFTTEPRGKPKVKVDLYWKLELWNEFICKVSSASSPKPASIYFIVFNSFMPEEQIEKHLDVWCLESWDAENYNFCLHLIYNMRGFFSLFLSSFWHFVYFFFNLWSILFHLIYSFHHKILIF